MYLCRSKNWNQPLQALNLLVLVSRVPYPLEKGDKLRAFHQLRCLAAQHSISLIALAHEPVHPKAIEVLQQYCKSISIIHISRWQLYYNLCKAVFTGMPAQVAYFYSSKAQKKIDKHIKEINPDHIYCQLIRTAPFVKLSAIPMTLDYMDVFSAGMLRRKEKAHWLLKPFFLVEYKRLLRYERQVFDKFKSKCIISEPDRALIPHPQRQTIQIVENGVDMDYFTPQPASKKYDVLFTGNMGYPPNINAAELLAHHIMPLVRQQLPNVTLVLAGANPHARVKALASKLNIVTGWVDDMRPWYASSRVFIAPMQIGTGLQNKLLEAMSMQLPAITSPLANSALGASADVQVLLGDTPEAYASHLVELLTNGSKAHQLALAGYTFVKDAYSWERATQKLAGLFA